VRKLGQSREPAPEHLDLSYLHSLQDGKESDRVHPLDSDPGKVLRVTWELDRLVQYFPIECAELFINDDFTDAVGRKNPSPIPWPVQVQSRAPASLHSGRFLQNLKVENRQRR
jgi:hypothetical protein